MKAKPDKFNFQVSNTDCQGMVVCFKRIENSCCEKLLGTEIDVKLKIEEHVDTLSERASQKMNALVKIISYMTFQQRKLIICFFIISYFSYSCIYNYTKKP